jgi:hypothetical protein
MVNGECMKWNSLAGRPFLEGCGDYNVWIDTGSLTRQDKKPVYYYRRLKVWISGTSLTRILQLYLPQEVSNHGVHSASTWDRGSLVRRWDRCNLTGFVGQKSTELLQFYKWHLNLVLDFARKHPSITYEYIEASLEEPNIVSILHAKKGIPSSCWGDCKPIARHRSRVEVPNETSVTR